MGDFPKAIILTGAIVFLATIGLIMLPIRLGIEMGGSTGQFSLTMGLILLVILWLGGIGISLILWFKNNR